MSFVQSFIYGSDNSGIANVVDFGAKGDGVTDDTAAIQAAIDACNAAGGGIVTIPSGTYIVTETIVLKTGVYLRGQGIYSTLIYLADGSDCDIIKSENYDILVGTNAYYPNNTNVPHFFGLGDLRIDGNKSNQTTGDGVKFYGNAIFMQGTTLIENCYNDNLVTEGANAGAFTGVDGWKGQEEGFFENVISRFAGRYGWYFRGPKDSHIGTYLGVLSDDGDYGFYLEYSANTGAIIDLFGVIHVYSPSTNTTNRKGIYAAGALRGNKLIGDACSVVLDTATNAQYAINSVRIPNIGKDTNFDGLTVTAPNVQIDKISGYSNADSNGNWLINWTGSYGYIGDFNLFGASGNPNGVFFDGSWMIANGRISGLTDVGAEGLRIDASWCNITAQIDNCNIGFNYAGGTTNKLNISIYANTGQTPVTGNSPASTDTVIITSSGVVSARTPSRVKTTSSDANQIDMTDTAVQTVTIPHDCLYTPSEEDVQLSFSTDRTDYTFDFPPQFISSDATNITVSCKLGTSSASGVGDIIARIEV